MDEWGEIVKWMEYKRMADGWDTGRWDRSTRNRQVDGKVWKWIEFIQVNGGSERDGGRRNG